MGGRCSSSSYCGGDGVQGLTEIFAFRRGSAKIQLGLTVHALTRLQRLLAFNSGRCTNLDSQVPANCWGGALTRANRLIDLLTTHSSNLHPVRDRARRGCSLTIRARPLQRGQTFHAAILRDGLCRHRQGVSRREIGCLAMSLGTSMYGKCHDCKKTPAQPPHCPS
jgi:hypothetical protein